MIRRLALALSGLLVALTAAASQAAAKDWGVYEMLTRHADWGSRLDAELKPLGGDPSLVLFFRDLHPRRGFPAQPVAVARQRGLTPVISFEPVVWGARGDNLLPAILDGDYDAFFKAWADAAKDEGGPLYFRFGFEMNGDWFAWGKQPERFKAAWRHVHGIFREQGADNVKWMFSPNVIWDRMTPEDGLYPYYPGAAYVDAIGIDGYNFGDHHDQWHVWQSYSEIFTATLDACESFGKPIYLSEIGCADDERKASWMADFLKRISEDDRIQGFIYFNHFNPRKGEPNWRLDSDAGTLQVFRSWSETRKLPASPQ